MFIGFKMKFDLVPNPINHLGNCLFWLVGSSSLANICEGDMLGSSNVACLNPLDVTYVSVEQFAISLLVLS